MDKVGNGLEEWEFFQNEEDSVRNIILSYLTIECDFFNAKEPNFLHSHKKDCEKYHSVSEKRRKPFKDGRLVYSEFQCDEDCSKEQCDKSHSLYEIIFHPAKFRTQMCKDPCQFIHEKFCPHAHLKSQLRLGELYQRNKDPLSKYCFSENFPKSVYFDLATFKTMKCSIGSKHNEKQCLGYHSNKDKRRNPLMINYCPDMCIYLEGETFCINSDLCFKSHNKVEMFYHPSKFKTKFCSHFDLNSPDSIMGCSYGAYCSFAHAESEIKIALIHRMEMNEEFFINYFKTVLCPFTRTHEKSTCVYSHNWQDYRRNPNNYVYRNSSCPKWNKQKTILNYKEGCLDDVTCLFCHGWKEEDFHPLNYKTRKCKNFNKECNKVEFCPFYHSKENKRKCSQKLKDEFNQKLKKTPSKSLNSNFLFSQSSSTKGSDVFFGSQRNNKSEIISNKMIFSNKYDSQNSISKICGNNKSYTHIKHSLEGFNSNFTNNFSSNNSFYSNNASDNELDPTNKHKFFYQSQNSYQSHYTHSPKYSSSSSENFAESYKYENNSGIINPDDSIEYCGIIDKNDFYVRNSNAYEKSSSVNVDDLEKNNILLKELLKESDMLLGPDNTATTKDDILNFLNENNFKILFEKLKTNQLDFKILTTLSDEHLLSLIEKENKEKFGKLRSLLLKIDENLDGDDLLKIINKQYDTNYYSNFD
jgi:hypothetical protein